MLCAWAGGRTGVGLFVVGSEDRAGHPPECLDHLPLRDVNIFDEAGDSGPCGLPGPRPALRSGVRPPYWYRHSPSVGLHIARRRRGQHPDPWHRAAPASSPAACLPRRVGPYLSTRAVVPYLIKQRSGSIINMASCIAQIGLARRVSYAASKGAVLSMTKSMQVDLAPHGIRVNALLPGTILTPFVERYLKESYKDPKAGYASIRKRQLTTELGRPEDVAWAALYLASDESKFVMASGLIVDGGVSGAK